jgi:hypothetical protein
MIREPDLARSSFPVQNAGCVSNIGVFSISPTATPVSSPYPYVHMEGVIKKKEFVPTPLQNTLQLGLTSMAKLARRPVLRTRFCLLNANDGLKSRRTCLLTGELDRIRPSGPATGRGGKS